MAHTLTSPGASSSGAGCLGGRTLDQGSPVVSGGRCSAIHTGDDWRFPILIRGGTLLHLLARYSAGSSASASASSSAPLIPSALAIFNAAESVGMCSPRSILPA